MPLTFAHPAVVLPVGRLFKHQLSLTGLVIGSMVPDFEYFFRMHLTSIYSHTWPGLVWFDVPLAFILVILYELYIKDPLITHLPGMLNRKFYWFRGYRSHYTAGYFIMIIISVSIGAASHLFWDNFTHPGGQFVNEIPYLRHIVRIHGYHLYLFTILQHVSTAFGLLLIMIVCLSLRKGELTKAANITGFWLQIILVMVVTIAIRLATGLHLHDYSNVIITLIDGGLIGLIIASVIAS